MKKLSIIVLSLFVIITNCKKETPERQGYINFFIGEVFLFENNVKRAVASGDTIKQGMKIATGANGTVEIFIGDHMIKILKNSSVLFKELSKNTANNSETSLFQLEKGEIFSSITKKLSKESKFIIQTSTTVASVRGTDFTVSQKDKKGIVACLNGKIEVLNSSLTDNNKVMLNGGEEVAVEENKPMNIRELSAHNKANIKKIITDFKKMRQEIRDKFKEERERYREGVREQKRKDQENLKEQMEKNRENIDNIKDDAKENIEKAKDTSNIKKIKEDSAVDKQKEKAKGLLDKVKPNMDVKPKIKK